MVSGAAGGGGGAGRQGLSPGATMKHSVRDLLEAQQPNPDDCGKGLVWLSVRRALRLARLGNRGCARGERSRPLVQLLVRYRGKMTMDTNP